MLMRIRAAIATIRFSRRPPRPLRCFTYTLSSGVLAALLTSAPLLAQGIAIEPAQTPSPAAVASTAMRYSPQDLRTLTAKFLAQHYKGGSRNEIQVGTVDPRVGLKWCNQAPQLEARDPTGQGGPIHVNISCAGPVAWSLYVPATITLYDWVPIATSDLTRGHRLTQADIHIQEIAISQYRYKIVTDAASLLDLELKRNIGKGAVFVPTALAPATLVRRNDLVSIVSDSGGITISVEGTALADARLGETLRVRNNQSKRIVSGTVIASGSVKVN